MRRFTMILMVGIAILITPMAASSDDTATEQLQTDLVHANLGPVSFTLRKPVTDLPLLEQTVVLGLNLCNLPFASRVGSLLSMFGLNFCEAESD